MNVERTTGDILRADAEILVNPWNRNVIPWWLLLPQGVSGAIKREGGYGPFRELARMGPIPLGGAVLTGPGRLRFRAIIHVAGINLCWFATERSVRDAVRNAMAIVERERFPSVAFPLIGSGSGNRGRDWSCRVMLEAFGEIESGARVLLVAPDLRA